jgi:hypothetical protein
MNARYSLTPKQREDSERAAGWPFDGKRLEDDPAWEGSILNPQNWPPSMRPVNWDEYAKEKNDESKNTSEH